MKYIIICLFFVGISFGHAQDNPSFYVKIPDATYSPVITHDYKGNRINSSNTGNVRLDFLINSYEIYSVVRVFENSSKASLDNFYMVECNDIQLMHDLNNNYGRLFVEVIEVYGQTLVFPNDFGTTGGYTNVDQEELNYINGPQAWDITSGSENVIIGIADMHMQPMHEDFINKVTVVGGPNNPNATSGSSQHGSWVASFAAADTDNSLGLSAIGHDSSIYSYRGFTSGVDELSKMEGVKVVNSAWVSSSSSSLQDVYNTVVEDRGVVVVASAGNGAAVHGSASILIYPAAFKNVISVSGIGHQDEVFGTREIFLDSHEFLRNSELATTQHNDSVDIVAPAMGLSFVDPRGGLTSYGDNGSGTSFASPIVSGTIGLMFSQNYCLKPKEIETILKLTADRIDHLPQNLPYFGKLGAGKLNAYEAVKMARDMKIPFATVEVKDRILYRPWFYKLVTAPHRIKMINNEVSGGSKLKFRAKDFIEIVSGDYSPGTGGYIDLQIDPSLTTCEVPAGIASPIEEDEKIYNKGQAEQVFMVSPTMVKSEMNVVNKVSREALISEIVIYDFFNQVVFTETSISSPDIKLDLSGLRPGIYVIKGYSVNNEELMSTKFVKQ